MNPVTIAAVDAYTLAKTVHILGAAVLFGTGLGIAFFMYRGRALAHPNARHAMAETTVLADWLFTTPVVILQPLTGLALVHIAGYDPFEFWLVATYGLYAVAGLCWLPVVWIQIQLRDMARASLDAGTDLPDRYKRLSRLWFILGWPAFAAVIAIFCLMVAKPTW